MRRTTKAALIFAAVVGMAAAVTMVVAGVAAARPAGVAAAHTPKPSPAPTPTPPAGAYVITDLGSLGYGVTRGLAINSNGQVTGYSYTGATIPSGGCCANCYTNHKTPCVAHIYHAFVWSNGTMTDLGTLGGHYSQGNAINLSGEVVGSADATTGSSSFLWDGTKMTALTGLGASGINDSGQIAGGCTDAVGSHACLDAGGTITQLPAPSGLSGCGAVAINNAGQVLGSCGDASGNARAVLWQNGTPTVLPTLGGPQITPTALNNLGQVTGYAMTSSYAQHGFLYSNGTMTDLGNNFFPAAINDNGVIVGNDQIYSGGTWQNLNNLIPAGAPYQINYAHGINDNGQIVAVAYDTATNQDHTLVLTPH